MKLYLIQHGAALPDEVEPARPLSDQGRVDVEREAGGPGSLISVPRPHRVPH